jgi:broad specificity phosphatase PhoE
VFFVLRHGQTDWNAQMRLQGSTDIPLNETGRSQALRAAQIFKDQGIEHIITSPLSRAHETAEIVAQYLGLRVETDERLIERNFGAFEGLTLDEVNHHRHSLTDIMNPTKDVDGRLYPWDAEKLPVVIKRVAEAVNTHYPKAKSLFVSHGIPFRTIARTFLKDMYSSPNACPVRYVNIGDIWQMTGLDPDNLPIHASVATLPSTMGSL